MKVKDLLKLLEGVDPESDVLLNVAGGSIVPTDDLDAHKEYNGEAGHPEFFILEAEDWDNDGESE